MVGGKSLADQAATTGDQITLLPQGARESAMGGSYTAVSDDAMGLFCNPAALTGAQATQMAFSHMSWIGRTNEESAAYAQPLENFGMIGGGLGLYWAPAFDNTGGLENPFAPLTYEGLLSLATYAPSSLVHGLSVGGSLRYVGTSFGSLGQTSGLTGDLGLSLSLKQWRWGVSAQNISLATQSVNPPAFSLRGGVSYQTGSVLAALEVVRVVGQDLSLQLGGEYWLKDGLAFRAGVSAQDSTGSFLGYSFGVGLKVGSDYQLDYAASSRGDLGLVQWISLGLVFGAPQKVAAKSAHSATPNVASNRMTGADPPSEAASEYEKAKAVLPKGTIPTLAPPYRKSFAVFQKALATVPVRAGRLPIPKLYTGIQGFALAATVQENSIELSWIPQRYEGADIEGYNVYVSMVPGAVFKKLNDRPLTATHWTTEVGLHGMTYYFLVKAVGPGGIEVKSSELKDVLPP